MVWRATPASRRRRMYEHRLNFVHQLNQFGADIELLDSQPVVVPEPPTLSTAQRSPRRR